MISGASTNPVYKRVWGDEWIQTPAVFTVNGSIYSDVTFNIHHGFANTTVADKLFIGFPTTKIAELDWVLASPASGAKVSYQYWNGAAYAALNNVNDGSNALSTDGMTTWTVPSDWTTHSENGVTAYWIRIDVKGSVPRDLHGLEQDSAEGLELYRLAPS